MCWLVFMVVLFVLSRYGASFFKLTIWFRCLFFIRSMLCVVRLNIFGVIFLYGKCVGVLLMKFLVFSL